MTSTTGPRAPGSILVLADTTGPMDTEHADPAVYCTWGLAAALLSRPGRSPVTATERFFAGEHAKQLLNTRATPSSPPFAPDSSMTPGRVGWPRTSPPPP